MKCLSLSALIVFCTAGSMLGCEDKGTSSVGNQPKIPMNTTTASIGDTNGNRSEIRSESRNPLSTVEIPLQQDAWAFQMPGLGKTPEFIIYRFLSDGSYQETSRSDFSAPAEVGKWKLSMDEKGNIHLMMYGPGAAEKLYPLGPDTIIEYDVTSDRILLIGPRYSPGIHMDRWKKAP